nr:PREDICTED: uncharacterized protein LOC105664221 [Megachile rotundata]
MILGVPGPGGQTKVTELLRRLKPAFEGSEVKFHQPTRTVDMRVLGLDDAATSEDVQKALAEIGECPPGDIQVGQIKRTPRSLGTLWLRCPLETGRKIEEVGKVRVGWTSARIVVLPHRPMHCFKCLHRGHAAAVCDQQEDRSHKCYKCGEEGHVAKTCSAEKSQCPLCRDLGRPADHRLGARGCAPKPRRRPTPAQKTPNRGRPQQQEDRRV